MLRFNPTVNVGFYRQTTSYEHGSGAESSWERIGSLPCAWTNAFGDRAVQAQSLGVLESATVRTFWHPDIYDALRRSRVLVVKHDNGELPDMKHGDVYELWGSVDNVAEENAFMEFRVRRYESK